ncbi:hypothetical protein J132_05755 [Termitomyces sp. J132]|nr:hypothetical protein J132_05755 [Termitomyces sp. J132]
METTTHIDTLDTRVAAIMYKVLSQQRETAEQRSSQYQPLSLKLNVGQDLEVKKGKFRAASLAGILASSEFFDVRQCWRPPLKQFQFKAPRDSESESHGPAVALKQRNTPGFRNGGVTKTAVS